jgi:hypothetical protein
MGRVERAFIVWVLFCVLVYMGFCLTWLLRNGSVFPHFRFWPLIQFLFSLQNLVALLLTARDVQMRPSLTWEQKNIWLGLILLTFGIGWVIYLWKYAFRPRRVLDNSGGRR